MSILSSIIHKTIWLGRPFRQSYKKFGYIIQQRELQRLLEKSKSTDFGKHHQFDSILKSNNLVDAFREQVPVFNYNKLYDQWWYRTLKGEKNVCWPGKVEYFALTSGTSEVSSKHVPITSDMLQSIIKISTNQFLTLSDYPFPPMFFDKSMLMLGGSTDLKNTGNYLEGDLSGILSSRIPLWFHHFYKPGKKIAFESDWNTKLDMIVQTAKEWDIGVIAGVPAWIQLLFEKIVAHYDVDHIHQIWPNFKLFVHGGVSIEPYLKNFNKYLGEEIYYQETYLASEGYFAFQNGLKTEGMQLVLNNGTFFEFVPFNDDNFTAEGDLVDSPETYLLDQVQEGEEYAMLISTNAGTWRYLIGDTIKFTSVKDYEIKITGRTKHFLNFCGEHLSIDNMNKAIHELNEKFNLGINEFTVSGLPFENSFIHQWYIGTDKEMDKEIVKQALDTILKCLNDDYTTERKHVLKDIFVEMIPNQVFYDWLRMKGKEGGQHKFPRVLKGRQLEEWQQFVAERT